MSFIARAKNIIVSPKTEWEAIKSENVSKSQIFVNYVCVLSLIPSLAIILRYTLFADVFSDDFARLSITYTLIWAALSYISSIIIVLIEAIVLNGLSKHFGSTKDFSSALKIIAYSNTIVWITGLISVFPYLGFVGLIAAVYAIYTLYLGLAIVKEVPNQKLIGFSASLIILFIVINIMFAVFSSTILIGLNSIH